MSDVSYPAAGKDVPLANVAVPITNGAVPLVSVSGKRCCSDS
jgi:hypothetical protein